MPPTMPKKEKPNFMSDCPGMTNNVPFVLFTDVSEEDVLIMRKQGTSERKHYLATKCMRVDHDEGTFPFEIAADFHFHNFNFGESLKFTPEKMSTFLSMMRTVYNESFDLGLSMSESYELFRHLLLKHSCHRPPFSTGIFELKDVKNISDYVLDTFFRHYKMYKYVYVCIRDLEVKVKPTPALNRGTLKTAFACSTENERDPRTHPFLYDLFEEERRKEYLDQKAKEAEEAAEAKKSFEDRVMGTLARLEDEVDTKIKEVDEKLN
ncbi:unnamed protein product [Amoebophrya sp. A25]|nr:unnamed protein product [Amoebophrya sp. A25]|eukprot:GSA25T00014973001.1